MTGTHPEELDEELDEEDASVEPDEDEDELLDAEELDDDAVELTAVLDELLTEDELDAPPAPPEDATGGPPQATSTKAKSAKTHIRFFIRSFLRHTGTAGCSEPVC